MILRLPSVRPEQIRPSDWSALFSAARSLALDTDTEDFSDGDSFDTSGEGRSTPALSVPDAAIPPLALIDIVRGSAALRFVTASPSDANSRLRLVGAAVKEGHLTQDTVRAIHPIQTLSSISHRYHTDVVFRDPRAGNDLIRIKRSVDYSKIADRLIGTGRVEVVAFVERVGGATGRRAGVRIAGRDRMLHCSVRSEETARELGRLLYCDAVIAGEARWLRSDQQLLEMDIEAARAVPTLSLADAITKLRAASQSSLGKLKDPTSYFADIRA